MSLSDKELQAIQDSVETKIISDADGNQYSTRQLHALPVIRESQPSALLVSTLTALVDY